MGTDSEDLKERIANAIPDGGSVHAAGATCYGPRTKQDRNAIVNAVYDVVAGLDSVKAADSRQAVALHEQRAQMAKLLGELAAERATLITRIEELEAELARLLDRAREIT